MYKPIDPETRAALIAMAHAAVLMHGADQDTSGPVHITGVRICDSCQNADVEAFPYHVQDRDGRWWQDLCNNCFDLLGCVVDNEEFLRPFRRPWRRI